MADSWIVVSVDVREIINYSAKADALLSEYLHAAAYKIQSRFPTIFTGIVNSLGQMVGFPIEYIEHISSVGSSIDLDIIVTKSGITVSYDFEQMGSWENLDEAYHRGAALADGGYVEGPYFGQELKNPQWKRYAFWLSQVSQPSSWEEKTSIWGGLAPEWLFLQFGQAWEPATSPTNFMERVETELGNLVRAHIDAAVSSASFTTPLQEAVVIKELGIVTTRSSQAKLQRKGYFINKRGQGRYGFIGGFNTPNG